MSHSDDHSEGFTGHVYVNSEPPSAIQGLVSQKLIEDKQGSSTLPKQPSPFYDLLVGAYTADITYPVSGDEPGPHFDANGNIEGSDGQESEIESIQVVNLGGGCYRVGDNSMLSAPTLHWGDEFLANNKDGVLELVKLLPRKFKHYNTIGNAGSLDVVHRFGGGWAQELMCLLVTIPLDQVEAFEREIGYNDTTVFDRYP